MAEIATELVAVERSLWSGKATLVTAETIEGEIGVYPGHQPMLGQLKEAGVVTITPVEGEKLVAAVFGGFLSVSKDKITILADEATWAGEADQAVAGAASGESEDQVEKHKKGLAKAQQRASNPI